MLIVNADDWGRGTVETNRAAECIAQGRVTSVSAMTFMRDSERAATLACLDRVDVGLHFNLGEAFTGAVGDPKIARAQARIARFMNRHNYARLIYNPFLSHLFQPVFLAQLDEFMRLYGRPPSHVDGHRHNHVCTNLLFHPVIPPGWKVRRTFTFFPGQKGRLNLAYRSWVDRNLARRYVITDYFFSLKYSLNLKQMGRIAELARHSRVELMVHPELDLEYEYLLSDQFLRDFDGIQLAGFDALEAKG